SSSSLGAMPISAATVALYCLSRVSGSECFSQSAWTAWLASMLFQWSDGEPPTAFSTPLRSSGSLATTVVGLLRFAGFCLVMDGRSLACPHFALSEPVQRTPLVRSYLFSVQRRLGIDALQGIEVMSVRHPVPSGFLQPIIGNVRTDEPFQSV